MPESISNPKLFRLNSLAAFIPIVIYLVGIICFVSDSYSMYDFPLDDAWIHRVYSRSFAYGHGLQYNGGVQEAGSTSPSWAIVTSPAHWLEKIGDQYTIIGVKAIGVILGMVCVFSVFGITGSLTGSNLAAVTASSLFALEPRLLFSSLSGMETILLVALWSVSLLALISENYFLPFILISLMPVTRPESVIVIPVMFLSLMPLIDRKKIISGAVMIMFPFALWLIFCHFVNGHWMPNTFYIKARTFHLGTAEYHTAWLSLTLHGFASFSIYFAGVAVFIIWCLAAKTPKACLSFIFFIITPLIYLAGVVGTRHINLDGYYWQRWIDPAALILTVPFCIGYAVIACFIISKGTVFLDSRPPSQKLRAVMLTASIICLICFFISVPPFYMSFIKSRDRLASDSRAIHMINVQAGKWIYANTPQNAVVGVNDAGAIRYFGKRRTIDLIGLNNASIAFKKKNWKQALEETDWLAVFPGWVRDTERLQYINDNFARQSVFQIPVKEYTICNCPGQTVKVIFKKKNSPKETI